MRQLLYKKWYDMKTRCYNTKYAGYKNYGGRGIKVCSKWKNNFDNFYNWAINSGYKHGLQIDRVDNDKNYMPGNCRWTTKKENNRNRSITKINYDTVSRIRHYYENNVMTQKALSIKYSLARNTISQIVNYKRWN